MKKILLYLCILIVTAGARPAFAQDEPDFRGKIEDLKKKKLLEDLNLSQDRRDAFLRTYDAYMDKERNLHRDKREAFKKLVHMSALGEDIPDKSVMKTLDLINEIDTKIVANHVAFVKDMEKNLSPSQIARVVVFEQNFQMKMREKVFDIRMKKPKGKRLLIEPPVFFEEDNE